MIKNTIPIEDFTIFYKRDYEETSFHNEKIIVGRWCSPYSSHESNKVITKFVRNTRYPVVIMQTELAVRVATTILNTLKREGYPLKRIDAPTFPELKTRNDIDLELDFYTKGIRPIPEVNASLSKDSGEISLSIFNFRDEDFLVLGFPLNMPKEKNRPIYPMRYAEASAYAQYLIFVLLEMATSNHKKLLILRDFNSCFIL